MKPYAPELIDVAIPSRGIAHVKLRLSFSDDNAKTIVDAEALVSVVARQAEVKLEIIGCKAPTTDEALAKLADWLEGLAASLRTKPQATITIPIA